MYHVHSLFFIIKGKPMNEFRITWYGAIHGDITIEAESAKDAKEKLIEMGSGDLVRASTIWQSEDPISIDCVETQLGMMDEKEWEFVYGT